MRMYIDIKLMHALVEEQVSCQWGCVGAQCGWQEVAVVHCSCIA